MTSKKATCPYFNIWKRNSRPIRITKAEIFHYNIFVGYPLFLFNRTWYHLLNDQFFISLTLLRLQPSCTCTLISMLDISKQEFITAWSLKRPNNMRGDEKFKRALAWGGRERNKCLDSGVFFECLYHLRLRRRTHAIAKLICEII